MQRHLRRFVMSCVSTFCNSTINTSDGPCIYMSDVTLSLVTVVDVWNMCHVCSVNTKSSHHHSLSFIPTSQPHYCKVYTHVQ